MTCGVVEEAWETFAEAVEFGLLPVVEFSGLVFGELTAGELLLDLAAFMAELIELRAAIVAELMLVAATEDNEAEDKEPVKDDWMERLVILFDENKKNRFLKVSEINKTHFLFLKNIFMFMLLRTRWI